MKLITEAFKKQMAEYPLYSQENSDDPIVLVKFFNPAGTGTWLITEYSPGKHLAFGYVMGLGGDEFGYISLNELEMIKLSYGLSIERDIYFKPKPLSHCLKEAR